MLTHCKIDNYLVIFLKMYGRAYNNTFGNVMNIITTENGTKLHGNAW